MTKSRRTFEGDADGCTDGAGSVVRSKRFGHRFLSRILPGSVAVVAAFTVPEFSVGAGDLVGSSGFDDPPEPAAKPELGVVKLGQAGVKTQLTGVRYAAILNLDLNSADAAPFAWAAPTATTLAGTGAEMETVAPVSLPSSEESAPAFVAPPPESVTKPAADEASFTVSLPDEKVVAAAAIPEAAPVIVPAVLPAIQDAPSLPPADVASIAPVPMAQTAVQAPLAAAPALLAAPQPVAQVRPAARNLAEQVTPARIAAASTAPQPVTRPAPSAPASPTSSPAVMSAPIAAAAVPGVRARVSAPAPAAKPAVVMAASPTKPPAVSVPAPPQAAAIPKPRPGNPALAAPASSMPALPEVTARLLTRVDGKTAGAVDFQQTPGGLKVRLGSIVDVLADRYDADQLARIRNSAAGNQYLSLAELQAQGVPISYDPVYDEFNVGLTDTRPKAARKVHIDQISAPERGLGATGIPQAWP